MAVAVKKRVNPLEKVEKEYDYYIVKEKTGKTHFIYFDDCEKIVKILASIDSEDFNSGYIDASLIGSMLCNQYHPEMATKMFRPTGNYTKFYHMVLKIFDYYRYIDYCKDGSVLKNPSFSKLKSETKTVKLDNWTKDE